MGFIAQLSEAFIIAAIFYIGIILVSMFGINFSNLVFTLPGGIVIFNLSLAYTYYFRL